MAKSDNLRKAKEAKNDEFYTRLEDIEAEISQHPDYVKQFEGKTVFCNCDDPQVSLKRCVRTLQHAISFLKPEIFGNPQ